MRLVDAVKLERDICECIDTSHSNGYFYEVHKGVKAFIIKSIQDAPTEQPERKKGYIVNPTPYGECSECGYLIDVRERYNFCPNCGADMRGEQDE